MVLLFAAVIVSATSLVDAGKNLFLGEVVEGFGFDGNGDLVKDLLDITSVKVHLGLDVHLETLGKVLDEDKLRPLAHVVASGDAEVSVAEEVRADSLLKLLKAASALAGKAPLLVVALLVCDEHPVGVGGVVTDIIISLADLWRRAVRHQKSEVRDLLRIVQTAVFCEKLTGTFE